MTALPSRGIVRRTLTEDDIRRLWTIDRREIVERVYDLRDGRLVLRDDFFDITGWPPGEAKRATLWLAESVARGATLAEVLDGERLAGAAVVDTRRLGSALDLVQLSFLHVGRDQRGRGLGTALFLEAEAIAAEQGASGLYVSATPSQYTIDFYLQRGCSVIASPDPELFEREPEDIHLECRR